jgi:hypothetical protein
MISRRNNVSRTPEPGWTCTCRTSTVACCRACPAGACPVLGSARAASASVEWRSPRKPRCMHLPTEHGAVKHNCKPFPRRAVLTSTGNELFRVRDESPNGGDQRIPSSCWSSWLPVTRSPRRRGRAESEEFRDRAPLRSLGLQPTQIWSIAGRVSRLA